MGTRWAPSPDGQEMEAPVLLTIMNLSIDYSGVFVKIPKYPGMQKYNVAWELLAMLHGNVVL